MPHKTSTATQSKAGRYFVVALYAFAVFGWELVISLLLDPVWAREEASVGSLLHWGITAAGWLLGAVVIYRATRKPARGFIDVFSRPLRGFAVARGLGVVLAVLLAIGIRALLLQEWKLPSEYERLTATHGEAAPFALALLVLYYLCEAMVIVLVIALGQRAGELRFGRPAFPWGGFVLACTWGATHILLQGPATGLYAMCAAVLYGCIHSFGPRSALATYLLVAVAFML